MSRKRARGVRDLSSRGALLEVAPRRVERGVRDLAQACGRNRARRRHRLRSAERHDPARTRYGFERTSTPSTWAQIASASAARSGGTRISTGAHGAFGIADGLGIPLSHGLVKQAQANLSRERATRGDALPHARADA